VCDPVISPTLAQLERCIDIPLHITVRRLMRSDRRTTNLPRPGRVTPASNSRSIVRRLSSQILRTISSLRALPRTLGTRIASHPTRTILPNPIHNLINFSPSPHPLLPNPDSLSRIMCNLACSLRRASHVLRPSAWKPLCNSATVACVGSAQPCALAHFFSTQSVRDRQSGC
jgi:hypothetical protein